MQFYVIGVNNNWTSRFEMWLNRSVVKYKISLLEHNDSLSKQLNAL